MGSQVGQIEPFERERGDDWTACVERYFVANGITQPEKKVAVLLTVIGPKTYGLLRSFLAPNKPAEQSYARLVEGMKNHLNPKPLVIAERFKFHRKCQSESETVAQFLAELRRLAEHCDFGDHLEEALRDRLVCGLRNETTQRRLLAEADLTLTKAYDTAQSMETARRQAGELRSST